MNQGLFHELSMPPNELIRHIRSRLDGNGIAANWRDARGHQDIKGSAVLLLVTQRQFGSSAGLEPCLLLNKRSHHVLQPGDLCCPGGGVEALDKHVARFMNLPYSPLHAWSHWSQWRRNNRRAARCMAVLLTTGLREAWEEMRLNPFKVTFLGPLPVQELTLFKRHIFPLAAWVPPDQALKPNWEVARIIHIPLRRLLDPANYGRLRLTFKGPQEESIHRNSDFPCFIHQGQSRHEILWGATFRIAMDFLELVFSFRMPEMDGLPVIRASRGKTYLNGSLWKFEDVAAKESDHDF